MFLVCSDNRHAPCRERQSRKNLLALMAKMIVKNNDFFRFMAVTWFNHQSIVPATWQCGRLPSIRIICL